MMFVSPPPSVPVVSPYGAAPQGGRASPSVPLPGMVPGASPGMLMNPAGYPAPTFGAKPSPAAGAFIHAPAAPVAAASGPSGIHLVSLGCSCGPKLAFRELGRDNETLPFDWMCTTIQGLIYLLATDFQGFFDFQALETANVQGAAVTVYRTAQHSWWHDDPRDPATREKFSRRIQRFSAMRADSEPLLFVRLVATTEELTMAEQLSQILVQKFGPKSLLLMILGCQSPNAVGPYMAASSRNVLVYFLPAESGKTANCPAIAAALNWAAGQSLNCQQLQDFHAIKSRAMPQDHGYFGMGGLPAFENLPPRAAANAPPRVPGNIVVNQQFAGIAPVSVQAPPRPSFHSPRGSFNQPGLRSSPSRTSLRQDIQEVPPLVPVLQEPQGAMQRSLSGVVAQTTPRTDVMVAPQAGSMRAGSMRFTKQNINNGLLQPMESPMDVFQSFSQAFEAAKKALTPQGAFVSFAESDLNEPALKPGDWCEIWSTTHNTWCKAKVMRIDGQMYK